jgi:hypothetical protein
MKCPVKECLDQELTEMRRQIRELREQVKDAEVALAIRRNEEIQVRERIAQMAISR